MAKTFEEWDAVASEEDKEAILRNMESSYALNERWLARWKECKEHGLDPLQDSQMADLNEQMNALDEAARAIYLKEPEPALTLEQPVKVTDVSGIVPIPPTGYRDTYDNPSITPYEAPGVEPAEG